MRLMSVSACSVLHVRTAWEKVFTFIQITKISTDHIPLKSKDTYDVVLRLHKALNSIFAVAICNWQLGCLRK